MRETANGNSKASGAVVSAKTHSTGSPEKSGSQHGESTTLGPLSTDLAKHLLDLSKKVVKDEVNPRTVGAACKCAAELYKIMKLNWDMRRG